MSDHEQPVGDVVEGWTPRDPAVAVALGGRYVDLEPLRPRHATALFEALCGEGSSELWTYWPAERPRDLAAMKASIRAQLDHPGLEPMVICPRGDSVCGQVSLTRIEPAHGQVEVAAVMFAQRLQRTRAATEAIHLLMRHAFDGLGYRRFEWKCDSLNEPSRRAALRLGFTYEGRFRQHMVTRGRNRDTDWFSVVDSEWPQVRAAHRRWLDPANFAADGTQRTPLARP